MKLALIQIRFDALKSKLPELKTYTSKVKELGGMNKAVAPLFIRDFIDAMDKASDFYSEIIQIKILLDDQLTELRNIAFFDRSKAYCDIKGEKATSDARNYAADLDPVLLNAKELFAEVSAYHEILKNKLGLFKMTHDDAKKIAYDDGNQTHFVGV